MFHAITQELKGGYYGILTQGFPQLVRVNPDVLGLETEQPLPDDFPALCRARMIHEYPLIPDVERLEKMIAELPLSALSARLGSTRSPQRDCAIAQTASAAVSARRTRGPSADARELRRVEPPPIRRAESALGTDGDDERERRRRLLGQRPLGRRGRARTRVPPLGSAASAAASGCGRLDARRLVAAALLARALRDLAPMLDAPLAALGVELHDAEFRVDGHERAHAELRGLLHDEVHGVGLRQRLDQREVERATPAAVRCAAASASVAPRRCSASTLACRSVPRPLNTTS